MTKKLEKHEPSYERHRAFSIEYQGKPDSFYVTCECGWVELIPVWASKPYPGWDQVQWPFLLKTLEAFGEMRHEYTEKGVYDR